MTRVIITTPWTERTSVSTVWVGRDNIQSDEWYLLDDIFQFITTELDEKLIVHTGIFYDQDTEYTNRTQPVTSWI